jgi:hypothetical protein
VLSGAWIYRLVFPRGTNGGHTPVGETILLHILSSRFVLLVPSDPKLFQAAANELIAKGYAPQGIMAAYVKAGGERERRSDGLRIRVCSSILVTPRIDEHNV